MLAVGMLLIWGGYDLSLFGWCLFRDYNITFGQLSNPLHPYSGAWPPAKIPAGQTWPGKATGTGGTSGQPGAAGTIGKVAKAEKGIIGTIIAPIRGILPGSL